MKDVRKIVLVVLTFSVFTVLLINGTRNQKDINIPIQAKANLKETLMNGAYYGGILANDIKKSGVVPPLEIVLRILKETTANNQILPEKISNQNSRRNNNSIKIAHDGGGGWVYDANTGSLRINFAGRFFLTSDHSVWIIPNEIDFTKTVALRVHGENKMIEAYVEKLTSDAQSFKKGFEK